MDKTALQIKALAIAAGLAGEPHVMAEIAGYVVTVHAGEAAPEHAPASKSSLIRNLRPRCKRTVGFSRN